MTVKMFTGQNSSDNDMDRRSLTPTAGPGLRPPGRVSDCQVLSLSHRSLFLRSFFLCFVTAPSPNAGGGRSITADRRRGV
ncbi:hypothetical protein Hanom_Chr10g00936651 [Helianthus anomalus]